MGLRRMNGRIFKRFELDFTGNPSLDEMLGSIHVQAERLNSAVRAVWNELSARDSLEFIFPACFPQKSVHVHIDPQAAEYHRNGVRLSWDRQSAKLILIGNIRLHSHEFLEQAAKHLNNLLSDMSAQPERRVSEAQMLSPEEVNHLTVEWNGTVIPYEERCIHQFFEEQVERTPDAVALCFEDKTLTYRELNIRANTLAHRLRELGARPEVVVGIGMERSLQSAVCILAVLKSGAAYTVIEPDSPSARIEDIVSQSGAKIVLSGAEHVSRFSGVGAKVLTVDVLSDSPECKSFTENIDSGVTVENAAYILFTSGSTGKPKGVVGIHRSITHLFVFGKSGYIAEPKPDVCCLNAPLGFLGAVGGLLMPLCCGLQLVIIPNGQEKDPYALARIIHKTGTTNFTMVPALLKQLSTLGSKAKNLLKSIRRVGVSGSALDRDTIVAFRKIMPQATLVFAYVSTELGSVVFGRSVDVKKDGIKEPVPVGHKAPNVRAYILDKYMNLVPIGVSGELYVSADHLARGYAGQPELTAQRFLPDPFMPGKRLFRTGDMMRLRFDGEAEYLGRSDNQVKVRGFRVELGEIESALLTCSGVGEAVVVKNEREEAQRLVAYIVKKSGAEPSVGELREQLQRWLPWYMIPSAFFFLKQMPLTANGKIDRYALSLEVMERPVLENAYAPPKDGIEAELTEIWRAVLGIEHIGIHDDFLEIGGESLLAAVIAEKIAERYSVEIPLPLFFSNLTVALLAEEISRMRDET